MNVAVCVATMRRPVGLTALLESFTALRLGPDLHVTFVVVDNDEEASARRVVDEARERLPGEVVYVVEPRRGIPFARNRAVAAARAADWIAFVDDDEVVEDGWLAELISVAQEHRADVVTGAVVPRFVEPPPAWALRGRFFERPRFPTGTRIHYARTSNVLVAAHLLRDERPFNEALARTGGSDTHFFQRVRLAGAAIVWADDAVVVETFPPSRVRPGWVLQRAYRRGNTLSLCLRDLEDSPRRRAKRVLAAVVHSGRGLALLASSLTGGRVAALRGAQRLAFALGLLTGLAGRAYDEYAVLHGS